MADKPARKIVDGRVGDQFQVARNFKVPMQTPHGPAHPIPPGDGPVDVTVVIRPDFRRVPKNAPVHNN